jgi:hypothetical protein
MLKCINKRKKRNDGRVENEVKVIKRKVESEKGKVKMERWKDGKVESEEGMLKCLNA